MLFSPQKAGTQFKTSVNELMEILMSKEPSYIRCIKPNDFKQSSEMPITAVTHTSSKPLEYYSMPFSEMQ